MTANDAVYAWPTRQSGAARSAWPTSGTAPTDGDEATGTLPEGKNAVRNEAELESLLTDDGWGAQVKADGVRLCVEFPADGGKVRFWGRDGQTKTGIPQCVRAEVRRLAASGIVPVGWILDGEVLPAGHAPRLVLFDLAVPAAPFSARYAALGRLVAAWEPDPTVVGVLPVSEGTEAKRGLLAAAQAQRNEGIVLRRSAAPYVFARSAAGPAAALLRWKFHTDLDCIITAVDVDGHASAEIALLDAGYGRKGRVVPIGTVGTEGEGPVVATGQCWTVTCSGTYRGPGRQPRLMHGRLAHIRTDKAWAECTVAQLPAPLSRDSHLHAAPNQKAGMQ